MVTERLIQLISYIAALGLLLAIGVAVVCGLFIHAAGIYVRACDFAGGSGEIRRIAEMGMPEQSR